MNPLITMYKKNIGLDEFALQLSGQSDAASKMASKYKEQKCAITRSYVLNELGVEILVKMKKYHSQLSEEVSFCGGQEGTASAKIQFIGKYDDKVFGILKDFFIQENQLLFSVYQKKQAEKEYSIKDQELVNEKIETLI